MRRMKTGRSTSLPIQKMGMMKIPTCLWRMTSRLLVFLAVLVAPPVLAQTTTVSGTITDAGGQAWANGTYNVSFYNNGRTPPYTWNGSAFTPTLYSGTLNSSGAFSGLSLPSSNFIAPTGTAWTFTFCPAAQPVPCYTQNVIVTGTTLSLSAVVVPPAIQLNLAHPVWGAAAYTDSEIVGASQGMTYFNLTDNTLHICQLPVCSWQSLGSAGSILGLNNTWTGTNTYGAAVTFNGAMNATAGGSLGGAFSGNPTFSGNPVFSGAPSLTGGGSISGTWTGSPVFSGAPSFTGGGSMSGTWTGNPTLSGNWLFTGDSTLTNPCAIDGIVYVSPSGCYTTIAAAITAATNSGTTAGTVVIGPGSYSLTSTLVLGSETAPVSVYRMDGAAITCNQTGTVDCIDIPSHAKWVGANWGHGATGGTSGIFCGTSAVLTSLVTNLTHTGGGDSLGGIQNEFLSCPAGASISQGVLWWQLVSNNWTDQNVTIVSGVSGPARLWTNPASSFSGYIGPLMILNPEVNCTVSSCIPFEALGYVTPLHVSGGDINYHPGSAASGNVVVFGTTGSATSGPYSVLFSGTHFEFQTTGDVFNFNGVGDIDLDSVWLDSVGGTTATNCLHILSTAGVSGPVHFSGHLGSSSCTNAVTNASDPYLPSGTIAASALYDGDINYFWSPQNATAGTRTMFFDAAPSIGQLDQLATKNFAGTCSMSGTSSCTFTTTAAFNGTPICIASLQSSVSSGLVGICSVSGTTVTITASTTNSSTWAAMLIGNPN
jgi:hypothetical protein